MPPSFPKMPLDAPLPSGVWKTEVRLKTSAAIAVGTVQAGFPTFVEESREGKVDFNEMLEADMPYTFVVRARGQSMTEAGIDDGDLLVVDRSRDPRVGDIVIMAVNNDFTVKRYLKTREGTPYLHPETTAEGYRDIYPDECDLWSCFGVVRHIVKAL